MSMQLHQIRENHWIITASESDSGWTFHCLPPGGEPLTDDRIYRDPEAALSAGKRFVQTAIVRGQIGDWLDLLVETRRISSSEHATVLRWIAHLVRD